MNSTNSKFTKVESKHYDCCDNSTMFILDNGKEQFAVNIGVVLKCLKFAEEQGKIPLIPGDWWTIVGNNFDSV